MLEGGFLEDDIDVGRKLNSVMDEGEIEEKRMFKYEISGKERLYSRDLKRHQTHTCFEGLKKILLLPISCYLKWQIIF